MIKNKYYIGQEVWYLKEDRACSFTVFTMEKFMDTINYVDKMSSIEKTEESLYLNKQDAEKKLNKIKVGDVVYFLYKNEFCKAKAIKVDEPNYYCAVQIARNDRLISLYFDKDSIFKTEEELIESLRDY